ncbi:MAG: hypothetical protein AB7T63_14250 [Planctomycetota bacterium]
MISPLPKYPVNAGPDPVPYGPRHLPQWDRVFDAVERVLLEQGLHDPQSLRSPRPVEDALDPRLVPEGTLLVLSERERAATEADIEETVRDERAGGCVFVTLPTPEDLGERARALRELAGSAATFGLNPSLRPLPTQRLGRVRQVPLPLHLRGYRFLVADTPGYRVALVTRELPGGGWIGLWSGNDALVDELRAVLGEAVQAAGLLIPAASPPVPALDGIESEHDVWRQAAELRAYRSVREAELREIARQAALRGVQLRREREAQARSA